tara:strand:+ start:2379 stop:3224 length:846 start_codon:yes stop_codon:yes gene_type:complete
MESPDKATVQRSKCVIIDGSYFCFHRYHALQRWWQLADKGPCEIPFECEEFVEAFKRSFVKKILEIRKKLDMKNAPIFVAKDCPRDKIWRNSRTPAYKGCRVSDSKIGPFFKLAYAQLFKSAGVAEVLYLDQLEADDCIALSTKKILSHNQNTEIAIIASDMDYLQIVSENVSVYDLKYSNIATSKNTTGNPKSDLFCKIVIGDKSDNIPGVFKNCGKKTALRLFNDTIAFEEKLKKENAIEKLEMNRLLIDFDYIPSELCDEFNVKFSHMLNLDRQISQS